MGMLLPKKSKTMKIFTLKTLYPFLLLLFCTGLIFGQTAKQQANVSGALLNEQGKPLDYATVSLLKAPDSTVVKGTLSNDNGVYNFDHLSPGTYIIKATVVGYDKSTSGIFTIDDTHISIKVPVIKLQPVSNTLKTVTITSSKPLIERKLDRTVMNVENSVLAAGNSAMEILERAPGVSIDKDDNISLKGKQGVTVMINDKLTYLTPAQLATMLRSTDGTTIQSIEIITNPSAKYDAQGNSGIINIKLKKNKQSGTNGSITLGAGYGKYGKDNETLILNHKEGDLNIFGSFSHSDNKHESDLYLKRIVTDSLGKMTYFNQHTVMPQTSNNNSYRLGADYDITPKNTIGFLITGYFSGENNNNTNNTFIGPNFTQVDSSLLTLSGIHQTYHSLAFNLNDTYKIDTAGQQLNVDLDYSRFQNNSIANYNSMFYQANGATQHPDDFLGNITPSDIDIRTGKVDYTNPLTKSVKLETGLKFSGVKTDNNLMQTESVSVNYESVNHFVYDEKVSAGYFNLSKSFKKFSIQAGLRAEYTSSTAHGDSVNVVQNISRDYIDLFPSVFINQTINDKNSISFSYSRRIDRPQYDNLNPFVYHLDPYTFQKGNPYLKPQYTNNFELNYTWHELNLSLGYSRTTDVITEVPGTDPATKATFVTQANLQIQNSYNANLYAPYTINKWWNGNINATAFYLGFISNGLDGGNLNTGQAAYQIRSTQTFLPLSGYKAEVSGNYQSALTYGLFTIKPQYSVDAGLSHSFADKKANIKFSVSDIFNTRINNVSTVYQTTNLQVHEKHESRIARLTFTYNFGNNKIKTRQHQTGADEEKNRVKGAN